MLAVNTPAGRLDVYVVTDQGLSLAQSVPVGLEPVAVAFNADQRQAWVVNHLSDSISIVALDRQPAQVVQTLWVGDEPRDIVFAGPTRSLAFVTAAHRGQHLPMDWGPTRGGIGRADVWIFDADSAVEGPPGGSAKQILTLFGDTPRALASSADGREVYAAVFRSGNGTTTLPTGDFSKPPPADSADGVGAPLSGLIVRNQGQAWLDETGRSWRAQVALSLPDLDVFRLDAMAEPVTETQAYAHVGTTLFSMLPLPDSDELLVSNTDARNFVRFAGHGLRGGTTVRGHLVDHRITRIAADGIHPQSLNPHLDLQDQGPDEAGKTLALAQPMEMALSPDRSEVLVTAFGSSKLALIDLSALREGRYQPAAGNQISLTGGGPAGVVVDVARQRAYVATRFDNGLSVVDLPARREIDHLRQYNPEPAVIQRGRVFLYDAQISSGKGTESCASCHLFGDNDALAWDLGDPDAATQPIPNAYHPFAAGSPQRGQVFHPLKGPMVTQSMRGLRRHGPMHWRGDRSGVNRAPGESLEAAAFKEFNEAFDALMGKPAGLTAAQMQDFTEFSLALNYPPNPIRRLDNTLSSDQAAGKALFDQGIARVGTTTPELCVSCHPTDPAAGIFGTRGLMSLNSQPGEMDFKIPHFRDQYQKVGMFTGSPSFQRPQIRGFGYNHNGATSSSALLTGFQISATQLNQLRRFLLAFPTENAPIVGQDSLLNGVDSAAWDDRLALLQARAQVSDPIPECDLVVRGLDAGGAPLNYLFDRDSGEFQADRSGLPAISLPDVRQRARVSGHEWTALCLPWGNGRRAALDHDLDGVLNGDEWRQGSDSDDPALREFVPWTGLWWN
ncbi:MAG: hypothetical protein KDI37_17905, partial [Xanthomonadales bacterium]|nr:hypothetical protein [Xanthomonadales bacterium]